MKITIGNQNDKSDQLSLALINAKDGDIIELLPGEYFSSVSPFICTIRKNLTIIGKTQNKNDVKIYCSFTFAQNTITIFKNLTVIYPTVDENTLSLYDGAEFFGDNITVDRQSTDNWDTIYSQNSFLSFKDSEIKTGHKTKAIGLSLEKSQFFADNTAMELLFQKNSKVILKDSIINHRLELRQHSTLIFRNLTIDSTNAYTKNDLTVKSDSHIKGQNLIFTTRTPQLRILNSSIDINYFEPSPNKIHFKFDKESTIIADGKNIPFNNN